MFHCQLNIVLSTSIQPEERLLIVACNVNPIIDSLQCILGGRNLVHIRIVVAAIFDFLTEEDWGE